MPFLFQFWLECVCKCVCVYLYMHMRKTSHGCFITVWICDRSEVGWSFVKNSFRWVRFVWCCTLFICLPPCLCEPVGAVRECWQSPCPPGLQKAGPRLSAAITSPAAPLLPSSTGTAAAGEPTWVSSTPSTHPGAGSSLCAAGTTAALFRVLCVFSSSGSHSRLLFLSQKHGLSGYFMALRDIKYFFQWGHENWRLLPSTRCFSLHHFPGFLALQKPNVFCQDN